jgi:hypothetical protein
LYLDVDQNQRSDSTEHPDEFSATDWSATSAMNAGSDLADYVVAWRVDHSPRRSRHLIPSLLANLRRVQKITGDNASGGAYFGGSFT